MPRELKDSRCIDQQSARQGCDHVSERELLRISTDRGNQQLIRRQLSRFDQGLICANRYHRSTTENVPGTLGCNVHRMTHILRGAYWNPSGARRTYVICSFWRTMYMPIKLFSLIKDTLLFRKLQIIQYQIVPKAKFIKDLLWEIFLSRNEFLQANLRI